MNNSINNKKAFFHKLEQVKAKDFTKFLDAKGVTTICPMCGRDGEQVFDQTSSETMKDLLDMTEGQTFVSFFRHSPQNPGDSDTNYYYKMFCGNCGYITTHSVSPVLRWLDSLQSKDSESEK